LIRERVSAGIRNARASGKQLGRPRRIVSYDEILRLRAGGASLRAIAKNLGIGYGTASATK
jgi:DNA invertase Pin-like site-specific DNA recombinase